MELAQLISCGVAPTQARIFIGPINLHCPRFLINTRNRMAAFIAQGMHESTGFTHLEESFFYRDAARLASTFSRAFDSPTEAAPFTMGRNPKALANKVYAHVNGNGSEASGDGWFFRGRGIGQATGRDTYLQLGRIAGRDWIANPDDLLQPDGAVLSFCAYWTLRGLNLLADASKIDAVTARINPPMLGAAHRRQLFEQCLPALNPWKV